MIAELLRRSAWLAAGSAIGRLLPLIVLQLASRRLDAQGFATASAAFAWAGVAMSLSSAGLAAVMTQRLGGMDDSAEQRAMLRTQMRRSLAVSGMVAVAFVVFGEAGLDLLFGPIVDAAIVWPAAIAGAMWSQVVMVVAGMNGCHRARSAAATLAMCGLLQGGAMAVALAGSADPVALAWGLAVGSAAAATMAAWQLHQAMGIPGQGKAKLATRTTRLRSNPVLWHTVATASMLPISFLAGGVVSHGPDGGHQLALYFALEQLHQLGAYLPAVMGQALLPMISRHLGYAPDGEPARQLMRRLVRYALAGAVAGPMLAVLASADARWIVVLLGNPSVQLADVAAVQWMLANASLAFSLSLLGSAMLGRGQIMLAGQLNLMWGLLFLAGTLACSDQGTAGLQFARTLASLLLIAVTAWLLLRPPRSPVQHGTP